MTTREDTLSMAVPEGWQLVPIKPTEEMQWAGWRAKDAVFSGDGKPLRDPGNCYRAMLAAAPTPPAAEAPGQEPVARFGYGKLVVDFGTVGGVPAVFVAPAKQPGEVGASAKRENQPLDRMIEGEFFMTFPTEEQAKLVADALMNISAPPTYADAEAKGLEKAAKWLEKLAIASGPSRRDELRDCAAAIRALASPAPKELGQ